VQFIAQGLAPVEPGVGTDRAGMELLGAMAEQEIEAEAFWIKLLLWKPAVGNVGGPGEPLTPLRTMADIRRYA